MSSLIADLWKALTTTGLVAIWKNHNKVLLDGAWQGLYNKGGCESGLCQTPLLQFIKTLIGIKFTGKLGRYGASIRTKQIGCLSPQLGENVTSVPTHVLEKGQLSRREHHNGGMTKPRF
ncbi:hypothetical protein IFM89_023224 [Coptis chinensis]|uniref:Uncharacterized protein n=1 Tax=Coptis chinensis TaxID=261450 RepID=A0A835I4Q3_9MAGN|nr:hypothetical protein IFM89_023224 [Coptis chinensis]